MTFKKHFLLFLCIVAIQPALFSMKVVKIKNELHVQERGDLADLLALVKKGGVGKKEPHILKVYRASYGAFLKNKDEIKLTLEQMNLCTRELIFVQACLYNNASFVEFLADGIVDINARLTSIDGNHTALNIACAQDREVSVQILLRLGARTDIADKEGETPLHFSCRLGHLAVVKALLENNANVNAREEKGFTPLWAALGNNHMGIAQLLLEHGAKIGSGKSETVGPLILACALGNTQVMDLFLKYGVDIDSVENGNTAFYALCRAKRYKDAKFLLPYKPNVNFQDSCGDTALFYACAESDLQGVTFLLRNGADPHVFKGDCRSPLIKAIQVNNAAIVKLLLEFKADVSKGTNDGIVPLHFAVACSSIEVIQTLLDAGAQVNVADIRGLTALHGACQRGDPDIIELLVKSGASMNARAEDDCMPFHHACQIGNINAVKALAKLNFDIYALSNQGSTAIHFACYQDSVELVEYLEGLGFALDAATELGALPLHAASFQGSIKTVLYILKKRPDLVNAQAIQGYTPLHLACQQKNAAVVKALLDYGADLSMQTDMEATPLDYAVDLDNQELLALIEEHVTNKKRMQKNKKKGEKKKARQKLKKLNALANKSPEDQEETSCHLANANDNNAPAPIVYAPDYTPFKESVVEVDDHLPVEDSLYELAYDDKFKWPKGMSNKEQMGIISKFQRFKTENVDVKKLKDGSDHYRLRYGKYRVIFTWDPANQTVHLLKIALRKKVYKMPLIKHATEC